MDGDTIVTMASSFPMMADKRIIVVKSVQRQSSTDKKRLLSYIESPLESTILVLTAGKVDRRQNFYSTLTKKSQWVECKPLYENQAVEWIKRTFKAKGITISHEAAVVFVQQVGTSLWGLYNESEKLITSVWGKTTIGIDDVLKVIGSSRKYNPWELTDAVGKKDLDNAMRILKHLMEEGQSAVGLIINISSRIYLMLKIRAMLEKGISKQEISKVMHFRPFFARIYFEQVDRFQSDELRKAIKTLLFADHAIKTGFLKPQIAMTVSLYQIIHGIS